MAERLWDDEFPDELDEDDEDDADDADDDSYSFVSIPLTSPTFLM